MKIIGIDNFGREDVSEFFADTLDNLSDTQMQNWCDAHNSNHSSVFFKLVEDNYQLFIWEP